VIKVVQWETEDIGAYAARTILGHPELELVGVFVGSEERAGRDVADLVAMDGFPTVSTVGIAATADRDEIIAMDADCVVHCTAQEREPAVVVDDICALLASGKNVTSTALMHLIHPNAMPKETRTRIEEACAEGRSTFHGTGINPGFMSDVLPSMLSAIATDIRGVVCTVFHSYGGNPDTWIVAGHVGMGGTLEAKKAKIVNRAALYGRAPVEIIAQAIGLKIDDVTFDYDLYAAEEDFEIAACKIPKGSFAASHYRFRGMVDGEERILLQFFHRAAPHVAPEWPAMPAVPDCFRIEIDSVPRIVNETTFSIDHGLPTYCGNATHAVNAVPAICAAEPGIATRHELRLFGGVALQRGNTSHWRTGWS
jgi:hypothetical protein